MYKIISFYVIVILFIFKSFILAQNYLVVIADQVNLREKPDINSKIIFQLYMTQKIIIIKKYGKKQKINGVEGEWVYIDTQRFLPGFNDTYKGWVFDAYLADDNMFHKVNNFKKCKIDGYIGDVRIIYEFKVDGTYKSTMINTYPSSVKTIKSNGTINQYRNVILLKDEKNVKEEYFFIKDSKTICYKKGNKNNPVLCGQCE